MADSSSSAETIEKPSTHLARLMESIEQSKQLVTLINKKGYVENVVKLDRLPEADAKDALGAIKEAHDVVTTAEV